MTGETAARVRSHARHHHRGDDHVSFVRVCEARDDADERLPALLSLRGVRRDVEAASWGLLRVLLPRGFGLSAEAGPGLVAAGMSPAGGSTAREQLLLGLGSGNISQHWRKPGSLPLAPHSVFGDDSAPTSSFRPGYSI